MMTRSLYRFVAAAVTALAMLLCGQGARASLVAGYNFDAGNAADSSAFSNNGTVGASVAFDGDTPTGSGMSAVFNGATGANGIISVPNSASLQAVNNQLTVSFFMKALNTDNSAWVRIVRKGNEGGGTNYSWIVSRENMTDNTLIRTDTSAAFNQNRHGGVGNVFDGTWHHVAYVLNSGTTKEYIDGALVSSTTYPHGSGFGNTQPLQIGGTTSPDLVGRLDNVRVYDNALTDLDIKALSAGEINNIVIAKENPAQNSFSLDDTEFLPTGSGHIALAHPTGSAFETATAVDNYHLTIQVFNPQPGETQTIDIDKEVFNGTSLRWSDFHLMVMEDPQAGFTGVGDPTFTMAMDSSDPGIGFDNVSVMPQAVWLDGGPGVQPGQTWKGWLSIEIPGAINGTALNPATNQIEPVYQFTLWQQPSIVPEPATATLGLLSLGVLALRRKRTHA